MIDPTMKSALPGRMWRRVIALCVGCAVMFMSAAPALAQEDAPKHDARLDGYASNVALPPAATVWIAATRVSARSP